VPTFIDQLPTGRLLLDVSLWSADLAALGADVARVSAHADLLHVDASDTTFVGEALFFPDLVRAVRSHTDVPLHVHLMAHRPTRLAMQFADAGANLITVHAEADEVSEAVDAIKSAGLPAGVALTLESAPAQHAELIAAADAVVLIGTPLGTKGTLMDPAGPDRVRQTRRLLGTAGRTVPIIADGGIRANTVAALAEAGATAVVPGSLLWNGADLGRAAGWIRNGCREPDLS
jgi:ribulose-phosphate 3-epimerase